MIKKLWNIFHGWLQPVFRISRVTEKPERMEPHTVYVIGEDGAYWAAVFVCPCGCRADIWLNLIEHEKRPIWTVGGKSGGKANISPSVWRQTGCRSHFFIKKGKVVWAGGRR